MPSVPVIPTGPSIGTEIHRADQRTLRVLTGKGLSESDAQILHRAWMAERQENESLTQYLVRVSVLRDDAPQLLAMNWGDELLFTGAADLFRTGGLDALWKLLASTSVYEIDRSTPLSDHTEISERPVEPPIAHLQT